MFNAALPIARKLSEKLVTVNFLRDFEQLAEQYLPVNFVHERCNIFQYTLHLLQVTTRTKLGNHKRLVEFYEVQKFKNHLLLINN